MVCSNPVSTTKIQKTTSGKVVVSLKERKKVIAMSQEGGK